MKCPDCGDHRKRVTRVLDEEYPEVIECEHCGLTWAYIGTKLVYL